MNSTSNTDNGIYYFLGNITSHILHALPLYKELGGTFVVASKQAEEALKAYNIPILVIDDRPYKLMRSGAQIRRIHEYLKIGTELKNTLSFLEKNAKVVIFYELYDLDRRIRLNRPKTIFLTHGNMLKDYMNGANRLKILEQYDYMAAIGPNLKDKLIHHYKINPGKLLDLGVARTDEITSTRGTVTISESISAILPTNSSSKKIISYLPTFWGVSSIHKTGFSIVKNIPDDSILIFRPHPQTPKDILDSYKELIRDKGNIILAHEDISLIDIFKASSAIIGDVSSVMLEAILTYKPLLFAYDLHDQQEVESLYTPIKPIILKSAIITDADTTIAKKIEDSLKSSVDEKIWKQTIDSLFFQPDGGATKAIVTFVQSLD